MADATTPLLARDRDEGLPGPNGMIQDHPIFLRVCHSPWPFISQGCLVYIRAAIVFYLTGLGIMLLHYKNKHEIHVLDGEEGEEGDFSSWQILFQFSSLAYFLLWTYHWQCFSWAFTHLYYPDLDENNSGQWESTVLSVMKPPKQTPYSRKRFYFSLYYTIVHVVVFMNVLIYWSVLVPKGHGHFPKGGEGEESISAAEGFFGDGWFQPFCLINLWGTTGLIGIIEIMCLNSIKRQVPVPSHIFSIMFFLCCYLGWASFGHNLTGVYPFFWLDPEVMEYTEAICAYSFGFVTMGPTVFSFMYGLIGMRETLTKKDEAPPPQQRFNPVQFVQDVAQNVRDGISGTSGQA